MSRTLALVPRKYGTIRRQPKGRVDLVTGNAQVPGPPGGFTLGSTYLSGPLFSDAFGARPAPSPWKEIEKYKSLIFALCKKNSDARCRVPLRLYADSTRGESRSIKCECDPIPCSRGVGNRLATIPHTEVSLSAVSKIFEVRVHPFLDTLDHPDPYDYFDRHSLLSLISRSCDVIGNCWIMPEGNGWREEQTGGAVQSVLGDPNRGVPKWLWPLYNQYVTPVRMACSPLINYFQYFADHIAFSDLIWFRVNHSLRDLYGAGYSPTYATDMYSDLEDRFVAVQDQLLGSGPRPNLIATAADPLQPPGEMERRRFEQELRQRHAAGYAGGVLVNTGAWQFQPMVYPKTDDIGIQISEYNLNRMCNCFGVPPSYFSTETNLANLQAADTQHARDSVEPWHRAIASKLTNVVRKWDERLFFMFDPCVPDDKERDARIVDMKLKNGSLTINEAIMEEQWEPKPYGDEPWLPGTLVQPSMAQDRHDKNMTRQDALPNGKVGVETKPADERTFNRTPIGRTQTMNLLVEKALTQLEEELSR